ncbi:aminotransferase [Pseudonocardia acidicola]|uniref:Aminotransferase n=1 Tax=Pseudonocardia acidicola TaxID=2724939 RepID=A0ABX1S3C2_9PSEU|nr:aminotransferase [Pseudonocardia acidicola]NMH96069.1 aminotransferase [Pseudonocardia acidicola]
MRAAFGQQFDVPAGYLNTASIGMPPIMVAEVLVDAVRHWRTGSGRAEEFDEPVAIARAGFADLVGVDVGRVAIGSAVSPLVGLVAASVPDGTRVLVAAGEFTSVSHPFTAQAGRGVTVAETELAELPERAAEFDLVAVSVAQSADGRLVDLDALREVRAAAGTRVLLDVTQAAGWLPLQLDWADAVVGAGYKWLLSPRGAAWLAVHPDFELQPQAAGWYAGQDRWASVYGLPPRLATGARALDTSPAWFSHVGAAVAVPWLAGLDRAAVHAHCVGLADAFRAGIGLEPAGSAIVTVQRPDALQRLTDAGVVASGRAGGARLSFHLYNTDADVQRALDVLA